MAGRAYRNRQSRSVTFSDPVCSSNNSSSSSSRSRSIRSSMDDMGRMSGRFNNLSMDDELEQMKRRMDAASQEFYKSTGFSSSSFGGGPPSVSSFSNSSGAVTGFSGGSGLGLGLSGAGPKESYQTNSRGEPEFRVVFPIDEHFGIEDIVVERDNARNVSVSADKDLQTATGTARRNFNHRVYIPENVEIEKLESVLGGGQLILVAPVRPPTYAIGGPPVRGTVAVGSVHSSPRPVSPAGSAGSGGSLGRNQGIYRSEISTAGSTLSGGSLGRTPTPSGIYRSEVSSLSGSTGSGGSLSRTPTPAGLYRTDVNIGPGYSSRDIEVSTEGQKVIVVASTSTLDAGNSSRNEFRHEVTLPLNVDVLQLAAKLLPDEGRVSLEAPLRPAPPAEEMLLVRHK